LTAGPEREELIRRDAGPRARADRLGEEDIAPIHLELRLLGEERRGGDLEARSQLLGGPLITHGRGRVVQGRDFGPEIHRSAPGAQRAGLETDSLAQPRLGEVQAARDLGPRGSARPELENLIGRDIGPAVRRDGEREEDIAPARAGGGSFL
jgi:hypothetical protein